MLTPRSRVNLIFTMASWRPARRGGPCLSPRHPLRRPATGSRRWRPPEQTSRVKPSRAGAYQWAELMGRTFGFEVLACLRCGGRLRLVALIEGCRRVASFLFPDGHFPLVFPPTWR
jgi:hypothetical protein